MNEIENRIERSRTRFIASALVRGSVVCTKSFIDPETGKLVEAGKSWWHTSAIPPQLRDHFGRSDEEVVATLNRRDRRDEVATARPSNPQPKRERGLYGLDFGRGSETSHREPNPPPPILQETHRPHFGALIEVDDPRHPAYRPPRGGGVVYE